MIHLATIIQVLAPTAEAEEDVINSFYTDLQNKVSRVLKNGVLIIMGDFNTGVGFGDRMDYSIMGTNGFRQRNNRGEWLLTSVKQMICTYSKQNSNRPNHQDAGHGNLLTNTHSAKFTAFWSAGNSYLASKTVGHFLVLT